MSGQAVTGENSLAGLKMPVAFGQHPLLKTVSGVSAIACPYRGPKNRRRQILGRCHPARWETMIMNPRLAAISALCQEVAIPASVLVWIVAFVSAGFENNRAAAIV